MLVNHPIGRYRRTYKHGSILRHTYTHRHTHTQALAHTHTHTHRRAQARTRDIAQIVHRLHPLC